MKNTCITIMLVLSVCRGAAHARSIADDAKPSDHKEWLACEKDDDCTSVKVGCYYWQPVAKKFATAMKREHFTACRKSVPAGPQPPSGCVNHVCVNKFTVGYWKLLGEGPDYYGFQNQWIRRRLDSCLRAASVGLDGDGYASLLGLYSQKVAEFIREKRPAEDERLEQVLEAVIPCEGPVTLGRTQEKWLKIQEEDSSSIRARVVHAPIEYPLDDLYPPLLQYKMVLKECSAAQKTRPSPWGDMRVKFAIEPSGKIDPNSFEGTVMAAAHMREFADCLSTPFKQLVFPPPQDGLRVHVDVLYQVPFNDSGREQ